MKTLLLAFLLLSFLPRVDASYLRLNGDLLWDVTMPQAQFRLRGELKNYSATGTGTLKLVLWATRTPYPSVGDVVAEYTLPGLASGGSYKNFTVKTNAVLPFSNGDFYFTIAVVEYTGAGWRNQMLVPSGTKRLRGGDFVTQKKWRLPSAKVVDPPKKLKPADLFRLTEMATENLNQFPVGWRELVKMYVKNRSSVQYANRNISLVSSFTYKVSKKRYRGRRVPVGDMLLTYQQSTNVVFKERVFFYFQGARKGTYQRIATAYYLGESLGTYRTWGRFKFKR